MKKSQDFQTSKPTAVLQPKAIKGLTKKAPRRSKTKSENTVSLSHDDVAQRAYYIYLDRGSPQGLDIDHWLEAERLA